MNDKEKISLLVDMAKSQRKLARTFKASSTTYIASARSLMFAARLVKGYSTQAYYCNILNRKEIFA